jgi:enoyl-CoA hydratase
MKSGLQMGQSRELPLTVQHEHTIRLGEVEVFSTPAMINLMEHAARAVLEPFLEAGEESVGVNVSAQHMSATPLGGEVRAVAIVTGIDERTIDFEISAHDGTQQIGKGLHRRAVISLEKFAQRLAPSTGNSMGSTAYTGPLPTFETLSVHINEQIAFVTLNRPDKLNTITRRMTGELEVLSAWLAAHGDEARVVILTGAGRAFCAGDDVNEVGQLPIEEAEALSLRQGRLFVGFEQLPQPIIAAVNGYALGGGCVMAYLCDFRIASRAAQFGMPEIALGWPPGWGVSQLIALVGKARALELCLTAKSISAQQALEWGLVHQVVSANQLSDAALTLARQLLAQPPIALRETKQLIHADEGAWPKQTHVQDTAAYIRCLKTADAREGIAAFKEKRPPRFEGR